jgi:formate-nitrite transporter family protein
MSATLPLATPMLDPPIAPRDHAVGPAGARVTLVEYADFECPSCGAAHDVIQAARRAFGDNLRLVFRHFPLRDSHPHALDAARAAEAAAEQGQFWPMHDRMFQRQHALEPEDLARYARKLDLDVVRWSRVKALPSTEERVLADLASGRRSGVRGTPTLFINGVRYDGPVERGALIGALARAALAPREPGPGRQP